MGVTKYFAGGMAVLALQAMAAAPWQQPEVVPAPGVAPLTDGEAAKRLRLRFDEADLDKDGKLTQDEARRAGFGFVAAHFGLIDGAGRGAVNFEDVMRFMRQMRKGGGAKQG